MGFDPPGLEERPDDRDLMGFRSLMPPEEKKPGVIGRIVRLPVKVLALPFKLVWGLLRLPLRLFGIGKKSEPGVLNGLGTVPAGIPQRFRRDASSGLARSGHSAGT